MWNWEQYCDSCKLNRFPEKYAKSCRACACWRKTLDEYCDQHKQKCLSCDSRNLAVNNNYCAQHAWACATCSTRTPRGQIYCETHQKEEDLKRLIWEKFSLYDHKEVVQFNTWWNNNLATLINGNNLYTLWVLVYEPAIRNKAEILQKFEINQGYDKSSLESAKNKASSVRNELDGDNPILAIHPQVNSYVSFSSLITSPYVKTIEVPCEYEDKIKMVPFPNRSTCRHAASSYVPVNIKEKIPNKNPENYLKPLDVVWVKKVSLIEFYHVGVYLGNNTVCHFSSESKSRETNRTIITDWETFVKGCVDGEVIGYHAVIPFKHYELIVKQIDWARTNDYDKGWYCLPNNNCEHHANSFVFGIDYSRQVKGRDPLFWPKRCKVCDSCRSDITNNGKGSTIKLTDEIKKTNGELGKNTDSWYKKIKDQYETKIVVPPKDCKIM